MSEAQRDGSAGDILPADDDPDFERLLEFLRENRAFDFTGYKRPSLQRRFRHRMSQAGVASFTDYIDFLQVHPDEFTVLFNTILINVTGFYRDPESWSELAEIVVPKLLERRANQPIRIWSAGCSAGQEAYSVAMVLHDQLGAEFRERVKIYATDVDDEALAYARQAIYTEREIKTLPEGLREKYFDPIGQRYAFRPELRRSVIFGRNDLTNDAPISRIDLLLCRNTLMYFNSETQSRIVSRLAFALRPDGVLFLGKAEMLLTHGNTFEPLDLKRRFFRKSSSVLSLDDSRPRNEDAAPHTGSVDVHAELRAAMVAGSPMAQIAVDSTGRLAVVSQKAHGLLGLTPRDVGRPFQDLDISYRPVELRSQLNAVVDSGIPITLRQVKWPGRNGSPNLYIDILVTPLLTSAGRPVGVGFNFSDVTHARALQDELELANRQLETAYEELQSTNEELETTNEELQSTVEELETTNEELQSTNEELETMNEELQSTNDEFQYVNEQLQLRSGEVTDLNTFMLSILGSLSSAVIVVDRELVIEVWTRQAQELWGLREEEAVGQHLLNVDSGLPGVELLPYVKAAVTGLQAQAGADFAVVNRRGRTVDLHITVSSLTNSAGDTTGAILVMQPDPEPGTADSPEPD